MKKIWLIFITLSLIVFVQSCKKELPFPIDEVTRGVVVDIVRVPGTNGLLSDGSTTGDYKIKLTIPEQQGDYSFMDHVQLLAVLQKVDGTYESKVIIDNINEFPKEVQVDIAGAYSKFGLPAPVLGQNLFLTTNVVLKDGTIIPGWTSQTGFNNKAFAGWRVNGRAYSYNVKYAVACNLNLDDFVGTCTVYQDEWWGETPYPVQVTKVSPTELSIAGLFKGEATNPLVLKISLEDHSVSFGKTLLTPLSGAWWNGSPAAYNNFSLSGGSGTVNACGKFITFSATATVDAGSFGANAFKIGK